MPRAPALVIALALALAGAVPAAAREVRVPLRLDRPFLQQLLVSRVFRELGQTAVVLDDGRGCQRVVLGDPELALAGAALRIETRADVWLGTWFLGFCWLPFDWSGRIEIRVAPELDPALPIVHFRVVDSSVVDPEGRRDLPAQTWDWIKRAVHPRLETFDVDLATPLRELREVLPLFLEGRDAVRAQRLIDSVALADARVVGEALEVGVQLEAADAPAPGAPPVGPQTLTHEEIALWERSWQELDAFLTFVVKTAGEETRVDALRSDLLAVLIESREDLVETLAEVPPGGPDPVRQVFLRSWERLAPVLRDVSAGIPGDQALEFLAFVAAGDALRAIDAVGPEWGLEISSDGLRRLAGVMAPGAREDAVEYREAVDPELRRVLGFGPPLPASELREEPLPGEGEPRPGAAPELAPPGENSAPPPAIDPAPESPAPPPPEPPEPPSARLERWLGLFGSLIVGEAHAETPKRAFDREIALRLHRWVPRLSELRSYLDLVHQVLQAVSEQALEPGSLAPFHRELYRPLLLATAWQESCWRQFVRARGGVRPIRSARSSVGIMQVNERVWRGFYEIASLREDLVYNASAGSEILRRYLDAFLAKAEPAAAKDAERVAVATYAAYNAGPSALRRFRRGSEKPATPLDRTFSQKFRAVQGGDLLAVRSCFSGA